MASRIRNNMAATMVSSAYCIKTSTIMLILVWQGHFWLINGLRYILVIETHFVKLIFPFDKFIFLEFLVWQRIAFILKRPVNTLLVVDWFLESCNTFRKVSNVFFHCFLVVCLFVFSTEAAALIYFYCSFRSFECGALFCKIQDGSYFFVNSILIKLLTLYNNSISAWILCKFYYRRLPDCITAPVCKKV